MFERETLFIKNPKGMAVVAILGAVFLALSFFIPPSPPAYSPLQTLFVGLLLIAWAGVSFLRR